MVGVPGMTNSGADGSSNDDGIDCKVGVDGTDSNFGADGTWIIGGDYLTIISGENEFVIIITSRTTFISTVE